MRIVIVYSVWAFVAGASIPVMAILNAGLGRTVGGPAPATFILFSIGLMASLLLLLPSFSLAHIAALREAPARFLLGGIIAALYIASVTALTPKFGVGNTVMFVVSAQVIASVPIDFWGLFGAPQKVVTPTRIVGLCLLLAGLIVAQLGVTSEKHPS